ncbi:MAG: Dabb family protein [Oscillospiraceae bacterium]|nr:Dabb family protein [Oscillospiraceae bacterium]
MIKHIVVWRIADGEDKIARAEAIKKNLEALKDKIEVLVDIEVGLNFNTTEAASDVVLVSIFNSREDLEEYQEHPEHKAVGQSYIRPYVKERRVIDFEY